jgi:NAD(P)H-hydrate epimerase
MADESAQKPQQDQAVTVDQLRAMEQVHISAGGTYLELMERAAEHAAAFIQDKFNPLKTLVLCGPGNNGGDAYGTARLLKQAGFEVDVAMDTASDHRQSPEAQAERNAWHGPLYDFTDVDYGVYGLIVDGLFGVGLSENLRGSYLKVVQKVNESPAKVVSLDMPSGLAADTGEVKGQAIRADYTVTFHRPKRGHYEKEGPDHTGNLILRDVGIVIGEL